MLKEIRVTLLMENESSENGKNHSQVKSFTRCITYPTIIGRHRSVNTINKKDSAGLVEIVHMHMENQSSESHMTMSHQDLKARKVLS